MLPVLFEAETKAVIELASLERVHVDASHLSLAADRKHRHRAQYHRSDHAHGRLAAAVAKAGHRAAGAAEELQQTNDELGHKAQQLAEQNAEVERKNQEIEQARYALEEKPPSWR